MRINHAFNLTEFNSYKIDSSCNRAFFPENEFDFKTIYSNYSNDHHKIVLGGGYNVILSKSQYLNDFILVGESYSKLILLDEEIIEAEAGASTKQLSEFAYENGLSGAEIFYDIPSSIGGAVVMNAGASGEEIKDILIKVRFLDLKDMQVKEIQNSEIEFEYRNSFFQRNTDKIVLRAWFKLVKKSPNIILAKMNSIKKARWSKQPKDFPNAGSVFKRPKGHYVGPMVEKLGLKGYSVGGAKVSEKHAGFIVNYNNATGQDILDVINHVKTSVLNEFGVELEVEQRII